MGGASSYGSLADKRAKTVRGDHDLTKAAFAEMKAQEDADRRAKTERLRALRLSAQNGA
ncbi:hypothetical protein C8J36_1237 [Rhizobium sp. PP-F2F-G48]|uniref:hypothetical protein n=1 Tax=Rhizobium sp. PP-F2F-G48 TaxID=2135651 RepID=UPI0010D186B4|nr:hypothetical protein [Rhizobium sp. PP-F2F-G48]TCM44835.1 hypothetical protein C8J36_1237 [Rhizobium sp. PP-F2F-G48]